jgi:hypothetical protein
LSRPGATERTGCWLGAAVAVRVGTANVPPAFPPPEHAAARASRNVAAARAILTRPR